MMGNTRGGGDMHNIFALLPHCDAFWSQIRSIHTGYSKVPNVIDNTLLSLAAPPSSFSHCATDTFDKSLFTL